MSIYFDFSVTVSNLVKIGGGGCRDTNLDESMSEFQFYILCIDFTGVIIQFFTKICRPPNSAALGYSPFSPYVNHKSVNIDRACLHKKDQWSAQAAELQSQICKNK